MRVGDAHDLLDLLDAIGSDRRGGNGVLGLVPEGRIGVAIKVEVRVRSEDPLLADGALPLAEGVFEIPGANAGRKVSFRGAP